MTLLYDGSYEGFLTLIFETYAGKRKATRILRSRSEAALFDEIVPVTTDRKKAERVHVGLKKRFPRKGFDRIMTTFLCDSRPFEKALYDYILLGFGEPERLFDPNHPVVRYIESLEREYFHYLDKMYGFLRFEELEEGMLYARIEGKFNLLPHLARHFLKRLDGCEFIIHDLQRRQAFIRQGGESAFREVAAFTTPRRSQCEVKFQRLWKTFFESVTIAERRNPKLQRNWVPLLYRRYMTEWCETV